MQEAKEILGGKCTVCGTSDNLEIDHIDRTQKSFTLSKFWTVPRKIFLEELSKCQLLCAKDHDKKTTIDMGFTPITTHGNRSTYTNGGCRCDLCKESQRNYMEKRNGRRNF